MQSAAGIWGRRMARLEKRLEDCATDRTALKKSRAITGAGPNAGGNGDQRIAVSARRTTGRVIAEQSVGFLVIIDPRFA